MRESGAPCKQVPDNALRRGLSGFAGFDGPSFVRLRA